MTKMTSQEQNTSAVIVGDATRGAARSPRIFLARPVEIVLVQDGSFSQYIGLGFNIE